MVDQVDVVLVAEQRAVAVVLVEIVAAAAVIFALSVLIGQMRKG